MELRIRSMYDQLKELDDQNAIKEGQISELIKKIEESQNEFSEDIMRLKEEIESRNIEVNKLVTLNINLEENSKVKPLINLKLNKT